MNKVWEIHPLRLVIIETLQHKGALTDLDLLTQVESRYGELSYRELNSALLKLEIQGFIRVTRLMKGKRQVELVTR